VSAPHDAGDARLETIEIKIAHLEATVAQLSDVLARQQREIDAVRERHQRLSEQFETLESGGTPGSAADEKPPHY
jgi:SlyX protein